MVFLPNGIQQILDLLDSRGGHKAVIPQKFEIRQQIFEIIELGWKYALNLQHIAASHVIRNFGA